MVSKTVKVSVFEKSKKFWEELISYLPFTTFRVFNTKSITKFQYECIMKQIKKYKFGVCSVGNIHEREL
jgi:hypothetical protein